MLFVFIYVFRCPTRFPSDGVNVI